MEYAFILTGSDIAGLSAAGILLLSIIMLVISSVSGREKTERRAEDVRHRPSEQNTHI